MTGPVVFRSLNAFNVGRPVSIGTVFSGIFRSRQYFDQENILPRGKSLEYLPYEISKGFLAWAYEISDFL